MDKTPMHRLPFRKHGKISRHRRHLMSETFLSASPASLSPLRLLLLGYGHVAQAFLPLLASRSEWLASELGIRAIISGIGTRSQGYYINPNGIDATLLARETDPKRSFITQANRVD